MQREQLHRSPALYVAYAAAGLLSGFALLPLTPAARAVGLPRDAGVGIALFGLLPLLIIALGVLHRKCLAGLAGTLLALAGWGAGYAVACKLAGYGSIRYNLTLMAIFAVPACLLLALLVYGLTAWRARRNPHDASIG